MKNKILHIIMFTFSCNMLYAQINAGKVIQPLVPINSSISNSIGIGGFIFKIIFSNLNSKSVSPLNSKNASAYNTNDTVTLLNNINKKFDDPFFTPTKADIELASFSIKHLPTNNEINWITTYEYNAGGYIIEKSIDGIKYVATGSVIATNTSTSVLYKFIDTKIDSTNNYFYRIRIIGIDAQYQYSLSIKTLQTKYIAGIYCKYDKEVKQLYINSAIPVKKVQIIDTDGKIVFTKKITSLLDPLQLNKLLPKTYSLKFFYSNNEIAQLFFVIN